MSKHIEELAEKAGFSKDIFGLYWDQNSNYDGVDLDKFAQLIIKECIECIKLWRDASDADMSKEKYWQGYIDGCDDSIVEIE